MDRRIKRELWEWGEQAADTTASCYKFGHDYQWKKFGRVNTYTYGSGAVPISKINI